ncbi:C40 family peptidase [Desmospora profundinema]|uniref:Cell wall-associated NlpC family hydrolase n=1 Tax=Desmospora profundinema TaxID=1571184 RepID=A0ABU1IPT2_9BACL|nr:C40 family peptidase [Desmospora profundinema]MDR6225760.1 cell wall-associated NlpC family hydrolase [Desmospora profundinema]
MQKPNMLKKVFIGATAAILVGTSLPAAAHAGTAAKPAANAHQMVQDIFGQVGLEMPVTQKQTVSKNDETSADESSAQTQPQNNSGSQPEAPAAAENNQPANNQPVENESAQPANNQPANQPAQSAPQQQSQSQTAFGDRIIQTGEKYMGTPYKLGARSGQTQTFDCSSFVQYVFGQNGVKLPRTATQQSYVGKEVSRSELQKGDLVFFKLQSSNGNIGHVGIYAGDGKLLHTYGPGGVRYDSMSTKWLDWGYLKAVRVTPNN